MVFCSLVAIQPANPLRILGVVSKIQPMKRMEAVKNLLVMLLAAAAIAIASQDVFAQMNDMNPMVGGAAMLRSRDIIDNAVNSQDHTTLVADRKSVV